MATRTFSGGRFLTTAIVAPVAAVVVACPFSTTDVDYETDYGPIGKPSEYTARRLRGEGTRTVLRNDTQLRLCLRQCLLFS